jgi:hypothetical protein
MLTFGQVLGLDILFHLLLVVVFIYFYNWKVSSPVCECYLR